MNWFSNFVGGGAYNLRIDYDSLDFPGPELGRMAIELGTNTDCGQNKMPLNPPSNPTLELATFAGGCFWGMELVFQRLHGVVHTAVGYTQGHIKHDSFPTYDQVCAGNTQHTEAVIVYYDPHVVKYDKLVDVFLERIDPTTVNGQGRDYGKQYRTGIYYHSSQQESVAKQKLKDVAMTTKYNKNRPMIATECREATIFWPAERYHQQYLENGGRFGTPQSADKGCADEIRCYG